MTAGLDEVMEDEEEDTDGETCGNDEKKKDQAEWVALQPFKDLYKTSPIIQMAFEFGPSCIPLSAVGMIFNFTGNHLLAYIH